MLRLGLTLRDEPEACVQPPCAKKRSLLPVPFSLCSCPLCVCTVCVVTSGQVSGNRESVTCTNVESVTCTSVSTMQGLLAGRRMW